MRVNMCGLIIEHITENGKTTICTEEAYTTGQMDDDMRANILKTRSTEMASIFGQMEEYTRGHGVMESNMERGNIYCLMEKSK